MFFHKWECVGVAPDVVFENFWGDVANQAYDFLVGYVKGFKVCFIRIWVAPNTYM